MEAEPKDGRSSLEGTPPRDNLDPYPGTLRHHKVEPPEPASLLPPGISPGVYRVPGGKSPALEALKAALGRPGIWHYVKAEHLAEHVEALGRLGEEPDPARKRGPALFRDLGLSDITHCDHCGEKFADSDTVASLWAVKKPAEPEDAVEVKAPLASPVPPFPRFWFESNQRWGYVGTVEELLLMLDAQAKNGLTRKQVLETARSLAGSNPAPGDTFIYGLRSEHTGDRTLLQHLTDAGFDVSTITED